MKMAYRLGTLLLGAALVSGCASTQPSQSNYSGWLGNYDKLQPYTTATGATSMRWIDPALQSGQYNAIMIDPVTYYPAAQPGSQVSQSVLNQIPTYLVNQVRAELGANNVNVVSQPGPGVLRLTAAITGVDTPTEGMQAYEVLPIAAVWGAAKAATGERAHNTIVYLEAKMTDSQSGKMLGEVVRKGLGENLSDSKAQLDMNHVKPILDGWAKDAAAFGKATIK